MDILETKIFDSRHDYFPQDRKSKEYPKINSIRTNLLKINEREAKNYLNKNLKINSHTTKEYLNECYENIIINLRTKQIQSSKKTKVSFLQNPEDIDIHPFFEKYTEKDYQKFHKRKRLIISKNSSNYETNHSENEEENNNFLKNNIKNKEEEIYLLTGKINSNMYFDFLHSLFFSLHKNYKKKKQKKCKNYSQNHRIRSSPSILKINNNLIETNRNIHQKTKRSNSNKYLYGIIKLIQCEEK